MTPTASLFLGSDLPTIGRSSAQSRLKDLEAKSALAKDLEAKSALAKKSPSGSAPASSGHKPSKTPAHAAAVAKPGSAPVSGRDGVTFQGSSACRFCAAPGHRVDQCPTVVYAASQCVWTLSSKVNYGD